jgi:NAD(P)-dependent dehydrogenase (short-subunit alcohol dehydrogenase family)
MEVPVKALEGKNALIVGGTGHVGKGIVRAFLENGATTIVPSRSEEKITLLRMQMDSAYQHLLHTLPGNIGTQEGADSLRDHIVNKFGRLDALVVSVGAWWHGLPVVRVPMEAWRRVLDDNLTPHFIVARTFMPMLNTNSRSRYLFINSDEAKYPAPNSGPFCIAAAAQLMLKKVLVKEQQNGTVRINALVICTPVADSMPYGEADWFTAAEIGKYAAFIVSDTENIEYGSSLYLLSRSQLAEADAGLADSSRRRVLEYARRNAGRASLLLNDISN